MYGHSEEAIELVVLAMAAAMACLVGVVGGAALVLTLQRARPVSGARRLLWIVPVQASVVGPLLAAGEIGSRTGLDTPDSSSRSAIAMTAGLVVGAIAARRLWRRR